MTMYDEAVAWVWRHRAACINPACGCSEADPDEMVAALIEHWLSEEP